MVKSLFCIQLISILLAGHLCYFHAAGQNKHGSIVLPVTIHNVEDGLAQSTVYQVLQDSRGLIWLATGGGLQYFDGKSIRSFDIPDDISLQIPGNPIYKIVETNPGKFILSTGSAMLHLNSSNGAYRMTDQDFTSYPILLGLFFKDKPLCWLPTKGLFMVGEEKLCPVRLKFFPGNNLPERFSPIDAVRKNEETILILSEGGLLELTAKDADPDTIMHARWIPVSRSCKYLSAGDNGKIYLLAGGIIFSVGQDGKLNEVVNTGIREAFCLFSDTRDNFWVSDITHKRVYRLTNGNIKEIVFVVRDGKHTDTIRPAVRSFSEDESGNLWFCTDGNGFLFHSPAQVMFDLSRTGFTRCITSYNGDIWAGTFKNGLWRLPYDLSDKSRVNQEILTNELYFYDFFPDKSGRLWIATNRGIYILRQNGSVLFHFSLNTSSSTFHILPGNRLYLSTYDELFSCDTGDNPSLQFIDKQTHIREVVIYDGYYWTGSQFGLFRKDTAYGIIESLQFREKDCLSRIPVYSILPADELIWTGTEHGIQIYSSSGEKQLIPGYLRELKNEIIYSIIRDSQNRIWISGNKGLACIPGSRDRMIRFSARNNLQSSEFNFNAVYSLHAKRIFFGGINGINGINTRDIKMENSSPDVSLIQLNISDSSYIKGIPPEDIRVKIHWNSAHVSGAVFSPGYFPSGTAQYSFFLENYQPGWSQPSENTVFSYRNIPPGNYRLWARCIDPLKNHGKAKCLVTITIRPPFWKTWWFIISALAVVIIITILIIRKIQENKYRTLLKDLEHRNAVDRERLRISQDMHDEIGSSLTKVAILSEIIRQHADNSGEMLKLTEKISAISGSLVDEMSDIIWAMNPKNDDLASFTSYVRQHVAEYLASTRIKADFSFPEESPAISMTSEQRRNIFLVIKEALHNVIKHSGADRVSLSLIWSKGTLEIRIRDNGKGFNTENLTAAGNGLVNMRKRIESLGGTFTINSMTGDGTQIAFMISL